MAWWVAQTKHSVRTSRYSLVVDLGKLSSRFDGSPLLPLRLAAHPVATWLPADSHHPTDLPPTLHPRGQPSSHRSRAHPAPQGLATYLLVCLWCWMTMFFSWIVSNRAVARDFRSEMDCGVAGRLHPWSSDNRSWTRRDIKLQLSLKPFWNDQMQTSVTSSWTTKLGSVPDLYVLLCCNWRIHFKCQK